MTQPRSMPSRLLLTGLLFGLLFFCLPLRASGAELRHQIDAAISQAWQQEQIEPAELASDGEFLRRVYLDLVGQIPTHEEAAAFLSDASSDKRAKLVDRLLEDPRFGRHQSDVWDMVFFGRNPPGYGTNDRDGFTDWLAEQFRENTPYDVWARAILEAEGNTVDQGAPMYYVQYKNQPEDCADAVTRTFLGVQLQCARCHDHPFENYSQLDFYGMAAFFARLEVVEVGSEGRTKKYAIGEKNLGDVLFTGPAAEQEPGKKGEPVAAKFLKGEPLEEPALPEDFEEPRNFPSGKVPPEPKFSRKDAIAQWITSPDNPYFAKAVANRVWAQFMGRGIVHPVDHFSEANPASHPQLLDKLAAELVANGFNLKWYIRELCNSRTYQLSAAGPVEEPLPRWFQRARVRPLSAEELLESWRIATWYDRTVDQKEKDKGRFYGVTWDYMIRFFGRPTNGVGEFQGGLAEHLYLNNGQVHQLISTRENSLYDYVAKSEDAWDVKVDRLYLSTLSRYPSEEERTHFVEFLNTEDDQSGRIREAIWALITCSEFRFNH